MKVGRNEPCPCGSGKKYKQCCLAAESGAAQSEAEVAWRRVHRALQDSVKALMKFTFDAYGETAALEAWAEFFADEELELDPESPHAPVFFSWFAYRWSPDPYDTAVADAGLHGVVPAQGLLNRKGRRLDPVLRRYMEGALIAPLTFYEVLSVDPGQGFRAREFFGGAEHTVHEKSASNSMQVGTLFFGMLVACEGVELIEAIGPMAIPTMHKLELLRFRQRYGLDTDCSQQRLCDLDLELIACYLQIADAFTNADEPELQNTDREPIVYQALIYDIDSAEDAFVALRDLEIKTSEEQQRRSAELDAAGRIVKVEFQWQGAGNRVHASWDNTILGNISISATRLRAAVNSDARAARLRGIIESRLGSAARYRLTEKRSMQQVVAEQSQEAAAQAELMQRPEVQAQLRAMFASHYESWVDSALPVLGGMTPLQAAQTREGREMLAILVDDVERSGPGHPGFDPAVMTRLRERLGLV